MEISRGLNALLRAVPEEAWQRMAPALELVALEALSVLYEPGAKITHVYFPIDAIISLVYNMADGAQAEIAVVGREGIVGVSTFMGLGYTTHAKIVQSAGLAYRLKAELLKDEFERGGAFMHLLLRYTQSLITQMAQTAVCTRHHSVDQQLCRWLLMTLDRRSGNTLLLTQEMIAQLLGVRRETVTAAAGRLQRLGIIEYQRGRIEVLDRPSMQAHSCECYGAVKREADRLLQPDL